MLRYGRVEGLEGGRGGGRGAKGRSYKTLKFVALQRLRHPLVAVVVLNVVDESTECTRELRQRHTISNKIKTCAGSRPHSNEQTTP